MSFVEEVLTLNSGVETFDHAEIQIDLTVSVFRGRRLNTGLSILIEGIAFYKEQPPYFGDLSTSLGTYFGLYGISDLEKYLERKGLPSAKVASIEVDGDTVTPENNVSNNQTGGHFDGRLPQSTKNEESRTPIEIVAGIVAGSLIVLLSIVVIVEKGRSRRGSNWLVAFEEDQNTKVARGSKHSVSNDWTEVDDGENSDEKSLADLSTGTSVYMEESRDVLMYSKKNLYDASRLDKVIAMAKQHTGEATRALRVD